MEGKQDIYNFLEERGVEVENIQRMKDEKIDADAIAFMDDDTLKTFVPLLGDRISLKGFCQKPHRSATLEQPSRKAKLMDRLCAKLQLKKRGKNAALHQSTDDDDLDDDVEQSNSRSNRRQEFLVGNKNAEKDTRKIELGWLDYNKEGEYKQMRKNNGGGTISKSVSKKSNRDDILKIAQDIFFKDGLSSRGRIEDFECDVSDFRKVPMSSNDTIGCLYDQYQVTALRFYLQTKQKTPKSTDDTQTLLSDESSELEQPCPWWDLGNDEEVVESVSQPDTPTVQFGTVTESVNDTQFDDTLPVQEEQISDNSTFEVIIVRRGAIIEDLVRAFTNPSVLSSKISVRMILPNGDVESAQGGGVLQDALTQFWSEFCDRLTTGTVYKVPVLCNKFHVQEWEAIGRIIVKGWNEFHYFPICLAPVFMEVAIYGCSTLDPKEAFFQLVPEAERETIEQALNDFPSDHDDLVDILGCYGCQRLPTEENLSNILHEIGRKEAIQRPKFIADCMRTHLQPVFSHLSRDEFMSLYEELRPTTRKVIAKLKFPEQSTSQQDIVASYLKRFVRSLDDKLLAKFLRFCTGSDIMPMDDIAISFNSVDGFKRHPVGHTCGKVLEVSSAYDSFVDLKQEFTLILESGVWVMDIV